jgi:putative ABC transport system permease protein
LEKHPVPHIYEWYAQESAGVEASDFVVRTTGDPRAAAGSLRAVVRGLSDTAIISPVTTLEQQLSEQISPRRFQTWMLGLFSLLALVLAIVGIYGVMAYSVAQRTREMGIRMALGARPGDVVWMVVREGTRLALIGVSIGAASALGLTRWMASLLFSISPTDPVTFITVAFLLTVVAVVACYIPAQRATNIDPMVALRCE